MKTLLLVLGLSLAQACVYQGRTLQNGETVLKDNNFKLKCTKEENGSWRLETFACLTPEGREVPVGTTRTYGNYDFKCETGADGMTRFQSSVSRTANCPGGNPYGSEWIVNNNFKYKCLENGVAKLIGCVKENTFIPLNQDRKVGQVTYNCTAQPDGTVKLYTVAAAQPVKSMSCTDSTGVTRADGETWVEKTHFSKICNNGYQRVVNCKVPGTANEVIPLNGKITRNGMTYFCESDGTGVQFYTKAEGDN